MDEMSETEVCHPLLLNYHLQTAYDEYQAQETERLSNQEHDIYVRSTFMSGLIRDLHEIRKEKEETDEIELSDGILERITRFRGEMWPPLQEQNLGIITDDYHPFPTEMNLNNLTGKDLDSMIDNLSSLLDQDQNAITHITRKLKQETDKGYLLAEMTGQRAKENPSRNFVRNQKV